MNRKLTFVSVYFLFNLFYLFQIIILKSYNSILIQQFRCLKMKNGNVLFIVNCYIFVFENLVWLGDIDTSFTMHFKNGFQSDGRIMFILI